MPHPDARRRFAELFQKDQRHRHPFGGCVEHCDMQRATLAAAFARVKRLEDRGIGIDTSGHIAHRDADATRRLGRAGDRGEPRLALNQQIIGFHVAIGTVFAIAADVAGYQPEATGAQLLRAETRPRGGARRQVLNKDVRARKQAHQKPAVVRLLDVQDNEKLLAAIQPDEIGAFSVGDGIVETGEIALGAFDFDHARAGIREAGRGIRAAATACSRATTRTP